jgi:hypothetical protein
MKSDILGLNTALIAKPGCYENWTDIQDTSINQEILVRT